MISRMRGVSTIVVGFLLAGAALASDPTLDAFVRLETTVADLLVEADMVEYDRARIDWLEAQRAKSLLESRLDEAVETLAESPSFAAIAEVDRLEAEATLAREREGAAEARLEDVRHRILGQLRRTLALRTAMQELDGTNTRAPQRGDPVTGPWLVTITPSGVTGRFDLELDGTLVSGTYRLDSGQRGSLRGTYVAERLKLERIDSESGFDMIFEVVIPQGVDQVAGSWRATLLSSSNASGGAWSATRGPLRRPE